MPGNHELWTTSKDPMQVFGRARYDYLVNMCDEMGVVTPEHPFPVWTDEGGPATIVPMFLLYDYTFLPQGAATKAEGLAIARERNVVATDEFLLSTEPYATRDAWCRDRVADTRKRLEDLDWMTPTVLVNHFPMVREPCDAMFYPEFSLWCGTTATADWHTRYNAVCSVYGHLHIPRTTWYDGVRFEEVSVGYPREWRRRKPYRWLRQILPDPKYAPGYLNEFGGHFQITQEMRDHAEKVQERIANRQATRQMTVATLLSDVSCPSSASWPAAAEMYDRPTGFGAAARRGAADRASRWPSGATSSSPCGTARGWPWASWACRRCRSSRGTRANRAGPTASSAASPTARAIAARPSAAHDAVRSVGIDAEPHDVLPKRCARRDQPAGGTRRIGGAARRPALGPNPVLRQGGDVQGVVSADAPLARASRTRTSRSTSTTAAPRAVSNHAS